MNIDQWAIEWGVSLEAIEDLKRKLGTVSDDTNLIHSLSEAGVASFVKLEASQKGCRLWRNNIGAAFNSNGQMIRYGLCNDTKQMNKQIKSSDLVGIRPVLITKDMVGQTIGQFLARETKESKWQFSGNEHEQAQLKFINLVLSLGGDAAFASSEGTI